MSLPCTKDLDELKFHTTEKERQNELAVKLHTHWQNLSIILDAYGEQVDGALDDIKNCGGRGVLTKLKKGRVPIIELMSNLLDDCDRLLVLTGKKKVVEYINSGIVAEQKNERILREAHKKSHSMKPKSLLEEIISHISKVKEINLKYAARSEKVAGKKRIISPINIWPPSKRKKVSNQSNLPSEEEFVPTNKQTQRLIVFITTSGCL